MESQNAHRENEFPAALNFTTNAFSETKSSKEASPFMRFWPFDIPSRRPRSIELIFRAIPGYGDK